MITIDECKKLIPEKVYLVYVDYNDSLDEHEDLMQECVANNNMDSLYEKVWELFDESEWQGTCEVMNELRGDLEKLYDEDEVSLFMELNEDELREIIRDRDNSDTVKDLCRNTNEQCFFYSLGEEFSAGWCMTPSDLARERFRIRRLLGMPRKDEGYNKFLDELLQNASGGGELRIYFMADFNDLITDGDGFKSVHIKGNVEIAIANSWEGSGHNIDLPLDFKLPFKRENLFIDSTVKYSYATDVCGMSRDWCNGTIFIPSTEEYTKASLSASSMSDKVKMDSQLNKTFRAGKCTAGDLVFNRHRNVKYHNEPPYCRHECADCGTVWID
jgi:hypothetical protein